MKLLKTLYGLGKSGYLRHQTIDRDHRFDKNMSPLRSDQALYILRDENGSVRGFSGGYVDDMVRAGNGNFRQLLSKTAETFRLDHDEQLPCEFSRFFLNQDKDGTVWHRQPKYLKQLETLPLEAPLSSFRRMRMKLACLANTRPDCMFEISQLAQVTYNRSKIIAPHMCSDWIRLWNTWWTILSPSKYPRSTFHRCMWLDSPDESFANNHDLTTKLGHIIFLVYSAETAITRHFK